MHAPSQAPSLRRGFPPRKSAPMTDLADPAARDVLMEGLVRCALQAGAEIWRIFEAGFEVEVKSDASPVTIADRAAEAIILEAILRLSPDIPVVAEEEAAAGRTPEVGDRFFLVDPLDGTKEFVRKGTDFTVNIGLIEDAAPTLGVIYAPARNELYAGDVKTGLAWWSRDGAARMALKCRAPQTHPTALASKSHDVPATEAYLKAVGCGDRISVGSSLKFCLLRAGRCGHLSAPLAHHGVGHRRRARHPAGRGRESFRPLGQAPPLRQARLLQPRLCGHPAAWTRRRSGRSWRRRRLVDPPP